MIHWVPRFCAHKFDKDMEFRCLQDLHGFLNTYQEELQDRDGKLKGGTFPTGFLEVQGELSRMQLGCSSNISCPLGVERSLESGSFTPQECWMRAQTWRWFFEAAAI